jgi:hypothetical protein
MQRRPEIATTRCFAARCRPRWRPPRGSYFDPRSATTGDFGGEKMGKERIHRRGAEDAEKREVAVGMEPPI